MQQQHQEKRQKMMQQMAFDYLRLLTDYEMLEHLDEESKQINHNIND